MGAEHRLRRRGDRRLTPAHAADRDARAGRGRLPHRRASRTSPSPASARRSPTRSGRAAEPLPGYRRRQADGVLRSVPDRRRRVRRPARRAREAEAQRRVASPTSPRRSQALGFGFRCGFLGLLHMEIVRERLEREFDLDLLVDARRTSSTRCTRCTGEDDRGRQPVADAAPRSIERLEEPYVRASVIVPTEYVGTIMELCAGPPRRDRPDGVPAPRRASSSSTCCRSPRSCSTSSTS